MLDSMQFFVPNFILKLIYILQPLLKNQIYYFILLISELRWEVDLIECSEFVIGKQIIFLLLTNL